MFKVEFAGGKEGLEGLVQLAIAGEPCEYMLGEVEAAPPLTVIKATMRVNVGGTYEFHASLRKEREEIPKEIKLKPFQEAGFRAHNNQRSVSRTTLGKSTTSLFSPQLPLYCPIFLSVADAKAVTLELKINPNGLTLQEVGNTMVTFAKAIPLAVDQIYKEAHKPAPGQTLYLGPGELIQRIVVAKPQPVTDYRTQRNGTGKEKHAHGTKAKPPMATQQDFGERITLDQIGGLTSDAREKIKLVVLACKDPDLLATYGAAPLKGAILVGPQGTGKTSIGRAIAHDTGINFWYLDMAQIDSKWYTEREQNLADFLEKIKSEGRGILYIDELQSVTPNRQGAHEATVRLVDTLNQYMDGFKSMRGIVVMAATNFMEAIDKATLDRFNYVIRMPLPAKEGREEILNIHLTKAEAMADHQLFSVNVADVAAATPNYSGRDLATLVQRTQLGRLTAEQLRNEPHALTTTQDFLEEIGKYNAEKKPNTKGDLGYGRHTSRAGR